jgi:hypothetical protein
MLCFIDNGPVFWALQGPDFLALCSSDLSGTKEKAVLPIQACHLWAHCVKGIPADL